MLTSSGLLAEQGLSASGWQVSIDGQVYRSLPLAVRWSEVDPDQRIRVVYKTNIVLASYRKDGRYALIMPPSWVPYQVKWNGFHVFDPPLDRFIGRIYESRILPIPPKALRDVNSIEIIAEGSPRFGGFRGSEIKLIERSRGYQHADLLNFMNGTIYTPIAVLNSTLALLCLMLIMGRRTHRVESYTLVICSVAAVPYILLSTDLYTLFDMDSLDPFKIQQGFQLVYWPSLIVYLGSKSKKLQPLALKIGWLKLLGCLYIPVVTLLIGAIWLSDFWFFKGAHLLFSYFALVGIVSFVVVLLHREYALSVLWSICLAAGMISLLSDINNLGVYPYTYVFGAISFMGSVQLFREFRSDAILNMAVSDFVNQFLPNSVHREISKLIKQHTPYARIIDQLSGQDILGILLLDICEWGKLNTLHASRQSQLIVTHSRLIAFQAFERVMLKSGFELIKTTGDGMFFCCGLYVKSERKETEIAERCLELLPNIFEVLHAVNAELRAKGLLSIQIKLSMVIGNANFGIERYASRGQFDVQGHIVNVAHRMEQFMNADFYQLHGYNVALIHDAIVQSIRNPTLLKKVQTVVSISDKHGYSYPCYLYKDSDTIEVQSVLESISNFFQPQTGSPHTSASIVPLPQEADEERRVSHRESIYRGEPVALCLPEEGMTGYILDYSSYGMGAGFSELEAQKLKNRRLVNAVLKFGVSELNLQLEVVRVLEHKHRSSTWIVGFRIHVDRVSNSERKSLRLDLPQQGFLPYIRVENRMGYRRRVQGMVSNVSADGLAFESKCRALALLPGMQVDIQLSLPFQDPLVCQATVVAVMRLSQRSHRISLKIGTQLDSYQQQMGNFLLQAQLQDVTPLVVKAAGFTPKADRSLLSIRSACGPEDLALIAALRYKVFQEIYPDKARTSELGQMLDTYDAHSRHILAFYGERLVATIRIVFNDGDLRKTEHSQYGLPLLESLAQERFVEMGRGAVDGDFRGGEVFLSLIYHACRIAIENQCRYIVISSNPRLYKKLYSQIGMRKLKEFQDPTGETWYLLYCDLEWYRDLKQISLFAWGALHKDVFEYFNQHGLMHLSSWGRLKKLVYNQVTNRVRRAR